MAHSSMAQSRDDISLIRHFLQGEVELASNSNLKIQPAQQVSQLLTRQGLLIASARHRALPPHINIRENSDYAELLGKMLLSYHYIPHGSSTHDQFLSYIYHPVPIGHQIQYTSSLVLWKYWWQHRQQLVGKLKRMDLLLFTHHSWAVVTDIGCHQSTIFVKTRLGEKAFQGIDQVVWLQPDITSNPDADPDKTVFWVGAPADQAPRRLPISNLPRARDRAPEPPETPAPPPHPAPACSPQIIRIADNKLLIRTAVGGLVVEGKDLNCYWYGESPAHSLSPCAPS